MVMVNMVNFNFKSILVLQLVEVELYDLVLVSFMQSKTSYFFIL